MDWKRAVREVLLIVIIIVAAYSTFYFTQHQTDFMYTQAASNALYDPTIRPYEQCTSISLLEKSCTWVNLPHGEQNIQLKQNNAFVYFIWKNQLVLGICVIAIFILSDIEKLKRMIAFFKDIKIEEKK
jgi:hypothetical protein